MITSQPDRIDVIITDKGMANDKLANWMDEITQTVSAFAPKNKVSNVAPTVNNDVTQGYSVFSEWLDTTGPTFYKCTDNSRGAAQWQVI